MARRRLRLSLTLTALALGLLLGCGVHAEEGVWLGSFNQVSLSEGPTGLRLWLDLHDRRGSTGTVYIVRPALGLALGKHTSLWAGYAWVPAVADDTTQELRLRQQAIVTLRAGQGAGASAPPHRPSPHELRLRQQALTAPHRPLSPHEHRLWQQAIVTGSPVEGLSLSFRPRLEERFLDDSEPAFRLRLFGRAGLDVGGGWGLVVWDELFVQLNEHGWTAPQGLDQNRLFLGPMIQPTPSVRVEVGYLNQWVPRPDATVMNHIGAMNLFLSF